MISRKEKSLGLLCHKFLARYPDYPDPALNNDICLDDVATELSTSSISLFVISSAKTSNPISIHDSSRYCCYHNFLLNNLYF